VLRDRFSTAQQQRIGPGSPHSRGVMITLI